MLNAASSPEEDFNSGPIRPAVPTLPALDSWQITFRSQNSSTRQITSFTTNAMTGEASAIVHEVVEMASGLNFLNEDGVWQTSRDLVEPLPGIGVAAMHGSHQVYFRPNLNSSGAITILTAGKRLFRTHMLGLYFTDSASGNSVCLSRLQDSRGEIHGANTVVYRSAFEKINADVAPGSGPWTGYGASISSGIQSLASQLTLPDEPVSFTDLSDFIDLN